MNYLKYIEFSAENLQFFLWFRDYCARFEQLPESEKALSPPWTLEHAEADGSAKSTKPRNYNPQIAALLQNSGFGDDAAKAHVDSVDPFNTPPKSSEDTRRDLTGSEYSSTITDEKTLTGSHAHQAAAEQAFDEAGLKLKPCTCRAFLLTMGSRQLTQCSHNSALP